LTKPEWVTASSEEVVTQAVQLAKGGMGQALVGQTLRDSYAIPLSRAITGKRLGVLLSENGIKPDLPDDLQALLKRVVHLQRHLQTHPKDLANRRGLNLMESRIRRLARYYRRSRKLPESWRYSAAGAALQVE
jgi:small subunit ribosomal protein S15